MKSKHSKAKSQRAQNRDPYERNGPRTSTPRRRKVEVEHPLGSTRAVRAASEGRLVIRLPPKSAASIVSPSNWSQKKESSELEQLRNQSPEIPLQLTNSPQGNHIVDDLNDIFDPFNHNTDKESFSAIKSSVEELNYLIDNAISTMISSFSSKKNQLKSIEFQPVASPADRIKPFYELLLDHRNPRQSSLLDAFIHDEVLKFLFYAYFQGTYFYGLKPDLASVFEDTFARIREREPWSVAQRWRSITVSSTFPDDTATVSQTEDLVLILKKVLWSAYPTKKRNFRSMIADVLASEKHNLHRLICAARTLSRKIQCDVLSCRIRVTIAPESDYTQALYDDFDGAKAVAIWKEDVPRKSDLILFTFSFGLEYESETETRAILLPEVITSSFLRNSESGKAFN